MNDKLKSQTPMTNDQPASPKLQPASPKLQRGERGEPNPNLTNPKQKEIIGVLDLGLGWELGFGHWDLKN
ncbi:MAG: hypothetical protein Q8N21_03635 [bacterium]|nr:hypothetical protein [bacterium]